MATIYNSDITKELRDGAKISLREAIPTQLAEKVVPVMEVNPKLLRRSTLIGDIDGRSATSNNLVAINNKTNQDIFITDIEFTNYQDATSDNIKTIITAVLDGKSVNIFDRRKATTTAVNDFIFLSFHNPIKIDRATDVRYTHTFTAGASIFSIKIFGYIVDNVNA